MYNEFHVGLNIKDVPCIFIGFSLKMPKQKIKISLMFCSSSSQSGFQVVFNTNHS